MSINSDIRPALQDYFINEFVNAEHPIDTLDEQDLGLRLNHVESRLAHIGLFLGFINREELSIDNRQELQRLAVDERSLYERIKIKTCADQDLRIAAIVGGALLAAALVAIIIASFIPTPGAFILVPTLPEVIFGVSGLTLGCGGLLTLAGTGIAKLIQTIAEAFENPLADEAQNLQQRLASWQQPNQA
jgi:hypothetical protein